MKRQLYVALDQNYITEKQFNELYELPSAVHAKVGACIKYLTKSKQQ